MQCQAGPPTRQGKQQPQYLHPKVESAGVQVEEEEHDARQHEAEDQIVKLVAPQTPSCHSVLLRTLGLLLLLRSRLLLLQLRR